VRQPEKTSENIKKVMSSKLTQGIQKNIAHWRSVMWSQTRHPENTSENMKKNQANDIYMGRSEKHRRLELSDVEPDDDDECDQSATNGRTGSVTVSSTSGMNNEPKLREKWNDEEMMALQCAFNDFLSVKKHPEWQDIFAAQEHFPVLKTRSKEIIKARFVHFKKTGR
jgi:hypothetical protein